jgi:hypothetical protein
MPSTKGVRRRRGRARSGPVAVALSTRPPAETSAPSARRAVPA